MKKIAVLVPESSVIHSVADPQCLFVTINQFLQLQGDPPAFEVFLVGAEKYIELNHGLYSVSTEYQFESSMKNINEVMFDVGYSNNKAFRSTFKRITGLTPAEYRKKYKKQYLNTRGISAYTNRI